MNGESKRREFRSYHPKNGRGRRTTTRRLGHDAKHIQALRASGVWTFSCASSKRPTGEQKTAQGFSPGNDAHKEIALTRNMVELRVTLAVEIGR